MLKKSYGFTMIEVLIALLVLAVGLLGMASLQVLSMQSSSSALNRSQATMIAYDLAERMRRNPIGALNNEYVIINQAAPDPVDCNAGCSNRELAELDTREWLENFEDITGSGLDGADWRPALPDGSATLARTGSDFTLTISWKEADSGQKKDITSSYEMRFTL